jgi:hypothetical protein
MNQRTKLHANSASVSTLARATADPIGLISFNAFFKPGAFKGTPNAIMFPTVVCPSPVLLFDFDGVRAKAYVPQAAAIALQA